MSGLAVEFVDQMPAKERWIVISNCQTHGLAHSLQMMAEGLVVEAADINQYKTHIEYYNGIFGEFDRVLIGLGTEELPQADFTRAKRVDKVPELVFDAYHPDLTYITNGDDFVSGPIGAYNSMIAFVAHRLGYSVAKTISLFNGRIYEACGYLESWAPARDNLIWYCNHLGYDVSQVVRHWGRNGAFMYSSNHPRIHVLYDIARLYLEREGYAPRISDVLPHDNLASSGAFAVYPEIGEALGVQGSYLFKRVNEYTQIGLEQFVEESFAAYDQHPSGALAAHGRSQPRFEQVAAVLAGEATA